MTSPFSFPRETRRPRSSVSQESGTSKLVVSSCSQICMISDKLSLAARTFHSPSDGPWEGGSLIEQRQLPRTYMPKHSLSTRQIPLISPCASSLGHARPQDHCRLGYSGTATIPTTRYLPDWFDTKFGASSECERFVSSVSPAPCY